jgi:hypothetical protein
MLTVLELQGMSLARFLWGWQVFSALGAIFVASPVLFAWLARGSDGPASPAHAARAADAPADATRPPAAAGLPSVRSAHVVLAFLGAAFTAATILFERGCVLVAPILSVVIGGLIVRLWVAGPIRTLAARARPRRPIRTLAARSLAAIASASAVAAMVAGVSLAATARSRYSPNERAAIAYLRDHARRGQVVLADWDAGYEIQAFSGLATATDGLLESAENRQRIIELYDALMDPEPGKLEALCRRCRARWLLVPSARAIYAMAVVTGDPVAALIARHEEVPRGPMTDHLILRLIDGDVTYPGFRRALEAGGFTVFEVTDSTSRSP